MGAHSIFQTDGAPWIPHWTYICIFFVYFGPPQGWQPQITMFWCDWILIYEFHQLQLVGYLGGIPWSQTSLRSLQTHLKIIKVPFGMLMVPSTPWPPEMKTSYFVPQKTNFRVMVSDQSTTSKKKKGWGVTINTSRLVGKAPSPAWVSHQITSRTSRFKKSWCFFSPSEIPLQKTGKFHLSTWRILSSNLFSGDDPLS